MTSACPKSLSPSTSLYRPRDPTTKDLYQAIVSNWHAFRDVYDERYLPDHGWLTVFQKKSFDGFLDCGILARGFARARCPQCQHDILVAYSCQRKGVCPSCQAKRSLLFSNFVLDEVLAPVAHRQMVFTLPKILRPHFKPAKRRTRLCQIMHQTVATFMSEALGLKGKPKRRARAGVIAVLQTFGSELNFNPHVHSIVAEGLFLGDDFHACPLTRADWATLEDLFRAGMLRYLVKQGCLTEQRAENILAWRHTSGFGVNAQVFIPVGDHAGMARLCRYIARPALSFERIEYDKHTGQVTILSHKKNQQGQRDEVCQITVMDLLLRLKHQIPPKGSHAQRYYGYYSSKMRGQRLKRADGPGQDHTALTTHESKRQKVKKKTWARLIQQVFEVDPLSCPKCGGAMAFVAFIQRGQKDVINAILSSLNVPIPDVEEMMRGPPLWMQIQQAREWMDDHPDHYPEDDPNLDQAAHINDEIYFLDPP